MAKPPGPFGTAFCSTLNRCSLRSHPARLCFLLPDGGVMFNWRAARPFFSKKGGRTVCAPFSPLQATRGVPAPVGGCKLVQPTALRERPRVAPTACDPTRRPAPKGREGATNECYALALAVGGGAARVNESSCTAGLLNFRVKARMNIRANQIDKTLCRF